MIRTLRYLWNLANDDRSSICTSHNLEPRHIVITFSDFLFNVILEGAREIILRETLVLARLPQENREMVLDIFRNSGPFMEKIRKRDRVMEEILLPTEPKEDQSARYLITLWPECANLVHEINRGFKIEKGTKTLAPNEQTHLERIVLDRLAGNCR